MSKRDFRSDMSSLGSTSYHLATSRLPFETNSIMNLINMHVYDKLAIPTYISGNISPELSCILMKLLEKSPENKYKSYSELYNDLFYIA